VLAAVGCSPATVLPRPVVDDVFADRYARTDRGIRHVTVGGAVTAAPRPSAIPVPAALRLSV